MLNSNYRKTSTLEIPMSIEPMIPEDNIARDIVEFVYLFDLQKIEATYCKNNGRKGYNVYSMFSVIIYAYTQGIYSCRAIEKQCKENIIFMWIMDLRTPDHSTIHRLQQRIVGTEKDLSTQQIQILLKKQLIDLANVSIDDTK